MSNEQNYHVGDVFLVYDRLCEKWRYAVLARALVSKEHFFLQSFKETLLPDGDMMFVLMTSGAFLACGLLLFAYSNHRFKKTLTL